MGRPKGSKNKPKEMKGSRKIRKTQQNSKTSVIELEEDRLKLQNTLDRIPVLSDDGYRLRDTIGILKLFGYTTKDIRKYLIDGTIPLK